MKSPAGLFVCLVVAWGGAAPVLETRSVSGAQLNDVETKRYERLKKAPGAKRVKLVSLNEDAFSNKSEVDLPVFDGSGRDRFRLAKGSEESVWEGYGTNTDRFVIRKVGKGFSGQILYKGKQYVLVPFKSGVSVLIEQDGGSFACGVRDSAEVAQ